ncbi:MAG: class I SAM-dependent methyltransferase [Microgenomates group bacterium]
MSDIIKSVQQMYDEIGTHFSRTRQKTYGNGRSSNWPVTDQYLSKLKPGQSVLDVGCGNGKLITGLPSDVEYIGTDFSKTLLGEAKQLYPKNRFIYGDVVDDAHWSDLGQYDAIFCVAVLHHIPEKKQQLYVLKQAKKHLKKGGWLYLTVWNLWQEKFLQYQIEDHFEVPYNKEWKRYCVAYDIQSMTDLMSEAGLDVQEMFFADREGNKSDMMHGQNLVCVAR